VQKQKSTTFI